MDDDESPWYNNTVISVYDPIAKPKLDKKFILTFTDINEEEEGDEEQ